MKQNNVVPVFFSVSFKSFFLIIFLFKFIAAQNEVSFIQQYCAENGYYNQGSLFQNNLYQLLTNITSQSSRNKFYNFTVGAGDNKVYGLYLCNGAYAFEVCHHCVTVAAGEILLKCPTSKEAIVWYGQCMLRYSNRSIISIKEDDPYYYFKYGPLNYTQYNQQLSGALIGLFNKASSGNSSLAFATGASYISPLITLMTYVECTPDLVSSECNRCLQTALGRVQMDGSQFGILLQPSCRLVFYYTAIGSSSPSDSGLVSRQGKWRPFYIAFITMTAVAATSLVSNIVLCLRTRRVRGKPTGLDEIESMENLHFDFDAMRAATDNFSSANVVGRGGFGVVYMGTLQDGQAVAVKRLSNGSRQGIREFKAAASLAAKLQHNNLVKLFGFCSKADERLLVYEFLPNKSLDRYLFDSKRGAHLIWETRHNIIVGIARGLLYLHQDSRFKIIHRDLKPANILLDAEMNPKITDFGMARLFEANQTQGNTSRIAGTFGYMAPEYAATGKFSTKSDVFSLGVILLEIVSGQRNSCFDQDEQYGNLLNYAWRLWNEGAALSLVDATLNEEFLRDEATRCIHIGLLCVQEDATKRPSIEVVLLMLKNEPFTLPLPAAPSGFPYGRKEGATGSNGSHAIFTENVFSDMYDR